MAAANPAEKSKSQATPIDLLNYDTAKLYTHVHPILLLSLYFYSFRSIVADPISTLSRTLLPLGVLQIAYVAICLPPTGSKDVVVEKRKPGEKKKAAPGKLESGINGKIIPAFLSLILSTLAATPLLFGILILFGAPITTHIFETGLCGAHIAFLSTIPLVYVHGVDGEKWKEIVGLLLPIDEVYGCMIGTMFGAWMGAVPIPLDWDREWQKWPITIVTGAYIGFAVGKLLGGTLLKGKRIKFE
ncbi:glycosylphosphatidylinositol anchor biosynthesis protein 11 [Lojkania enalia]|uniref:Glycosylphosphatidylinositol anchor biosynthesis protein 11 n=1 Tax=Lojkania enalia TaxID=147567 RepID=A0A9P4K9V8_9PLEO|nr:glycosylphosphatidylinositol anchor biosynthesis protein 11 [Didymosphaeria enalia]